MRAFEGVERVIAGRGEGADLRSPSFFGALLFAALAAGLMPACVMALGLIVGQRLALALYLVAVTAAYAAWLAPGRRATLAGAGVAGIAGSVLLLVLPVGERQGLLELSLGCALIASLVRSVLHYRARPMRGLLLEAGLVLGGLGMAKWLFFPSLAGAAAALWGHLLVQSLFCLVPGLRVRSEPRARADAFEHARGRLQSLLELD